MTLEAMNRLCKMRWSELEREAIDVGIPLHRIREAATRDELRFAIIDAVSAKEAVDA